MLSVHCLPTNQFHGGTLFHDAASGLLWTENQVSLGIGETLMAKERFEHWLWKLAAAKIHHLHSDNGIFNAELFDDDYKNNFQTQSFSKVGAHHQKALAERSIQTSMYMAWTFIVHISLHWSKYCANNLALWGIAVKHVVWLHNRIPNHLLAWHHLNYLPIMTFCILMSGDAQSMSLIQSYWMGRRV